MFALKEDGTRADPNYPIECYMDSAEVVTDIPKLMLLEIDGHPLVKVVTNTCPYDQNIDIIDLKLDVYGPKED
jgi:hypothetical protein